MKKSIICLALFSASSMHAAFAQQFPLRPTSSSVIEPVVINEIDASTGTRPGCRLPVANNVVSTTNLAANTSIMTFDGTRYTTEGQIDPQIAVGGNRVLHVSNVGVGVYDKQGAWLAGVELACATNSSESLDPKVFFDRTNNYFAYSVWDAWNAAEGKPMRFLFSQTDNPLLAWNLYSVPATDGEDGGSIGYGGRWVVYKYDPDLTLVMDATDTKAGRPVTVYKFPFDIGQPIFNQSNGRSYSLKLDQNAQGNRTIALYAIGEIEGAPAIEQVWSVANISQFTQNPPFSPQRGTRTRVSSGDFNPKNAVVQGNSVWFTHAVNDAGRSSIEWFELSLINGSIIQRGFIRNQVTNYMQPTIAVNVRGDMALGFQESNANMHISARAAYRLRADQLNTTRAVINVAEGNSPATDPSKKTRDQAWGDYSGSTVDGDNGTDFWFSQSHARDNNVKVKLFQLKLPPTALVNNVAVPIALGEHKYTMFSIQVPAGRANLRVNLAGGDGDCDIHTRFGSEPTELVSDFISEGGTNIEEININAPRAGTTFVKVYGYKACRGANLRVSY